MAFLVQPPAPEPYWTYSPGERVVLVRDYQVAGDDVRTGVGADDPYSTFGVGMIGVVVVGEPDDQMDIQVQWNTTRYDAGGFSWVSIYCCAPADTQYDLNNPQHIEQFLTEGEAQ